MSIQNRISQILIDPIRYDDKAYLNQLIEDGLTFAHIREMVRRIYDLNENQLSEISNANKGIQGWLNKKSTKRRLKRFNRKIDNQRKDTQYYRIYAEGDSWFQFPIFINDIIDWLYKEKDLLIYSEAYGGDWITNILYEQQIIPSLSTYSPHFFLISGGGNDLVGTHRLAIMVDKKPNYRNKYIEYKQIQSEHYHFKDASNHTKSDKDKILNAQPYLNKEFYAILVVFKLQYKLLFSNLYKNSNKHKDIISITQGYDFAIPTPKRRLSWPYLFQPFVNSILDSGNWLYTPLMLKGITDPSLQQDIIFTMIFEFNEMMIEHTKEFDNVFHIDNRGLANDDDDWFDELHLKSKRYKPICEAYKTVIHQHKTLLAENQKVISSRQFL